MISKMNRQSARYRLAANTVHLRLSIQRFGCYCEVRYGAHSNDNEQRGPDRRTLMSGILARSYPRERIGRFWSEPGFRAKRVRDLPLRLWCIT